MYLIYIDKTQVLSYHKVNLHVIVRPYIPGFTTKRANNQYHNFNRSFALKLYVDVKRKDSGATDRMVQFGQSENRKLREWQYMYWQQLNGSGDDMNNLYKWGGLLYRDTTNKDGGIW